MKEPKFDRLTKEDLMDLKELMQTLDPEDMVFNTPKKILEEYVKNDSEETYKNIEKVLKRNDSDKPIDKL